MPTIQQEFVEAQTIVDSLLQKLKERILALPDNPRIERLSKNAFVMRSGDLGNNWSPEYHDFKRQYSIIVEEISTGNAAHAIEKLKKIIGEGSLRHKGCSYSLHPDVVGFLKELLNEGDG